ncbi:MAG: AAA family ATPase [Methylocystis sp.]|nr:AAA family ATPase [Methylocystis sp.]
MNFGAQDEVVGFLETQGEGASKIIATHISVIVLVGNRAFKLKRNVVFPYLDFRTPKTRLAMCEAEYALNRRTAAKLYSGVRRVTRRANGALCFDGTGELVDAVVEMRRFDEEALLDRLAQRHELTIPIIETLAERIAAFHDRAPVDRARGGVDAMAVLLDLNDASLAGALFASPAELAAHSRNLRDNTRRLGALLDARRADGKVRRCHGDLTLRNICLFDGEPTPFDCIEFSDDLATIDVLYDLAFLLMDLWRRDQRALANLTLNRYLDCRDELDGLPLLPLFMALRASIRAYVTNAQACGAGADRALLTREARGYFDLALSLLRPGEPALIAVGGLSGTGKSSVAARLAPRLGAAPGARVLNSDRLRKKLFGAAAATRLPEAAYAPEVSTRVYAALREEGARVAANQWPTIIDAVFARPEQRQAIEAAARQAAVPFAGFWLEAAPALCAARVAERRNDVSDATREVVARQRASDIGKMNWARVDAARDLEVIASDIAERLRSAIP